jgi:hypothetical protein
VCVIGVVAFVYGIRHRERLFAPLSDHPAFMAGIWGSFFATVIGALSNDSGPVIFALGALGLLFATGYVWGKPGAGGETPRTRTRAREKASAG